MTTEEVRYAVYNYSGTVEEGTVTVEVDTDGDWDRDYWRERILEDRFPGITYKPGDNWNRLLLLSFEGEEDRDQP